MERVVIPEVVPQFIGGESLQGREFFDKIDPHTGKHLKKVSEASLSDVQNAISKAFEAQMFWAECPGVKRGQILYSVVAELEKNAETLAKIAAAETGKKYKDAWGELQGALALGRFYAAEGQRLFGRTTCSGVENRWPMLIREPVGLCALITPANTPIANFAWKVFPALICGNAAILKSSEDSPATSWFMAECFKRAALPNGLLSVLQAKSPQAAQSLVADSRISLVSFTGSSQTGRKVSELCGTRMIKCSLELGGKNPFVICDDADLNKAVDWALLSAFSNAGQRCASGSRIIVMKEVYEAFRDEFVRRTQNLRLGIEEADDLGPLISERQLNCVKLAVENAQREGAKILTGGQISKKHPGGFYFEPTIVEALSPDANLSQNEIFGPITSLFKAKDFKDACAMAVNSQYGLTAAIHTKNVDRAFEFAKRIKAGMLQVNAGTFGSEPHFPFGGSGLSGNGSREPGPEAIDLYSNVKNICFNINPAGV